MNLPLLLVGLALALVPMASCCRRTAKGPPRGPVNDPLADVWVGKLDLVHYMCGWPNGTSSSSTQSGLQPRPNRIVDFTQLFPPNMEPIHSMVYFRGQVYEWGIGLLRSYANGTLGRDPHGCPVSWALLPGQSNCTMGQAAMAAGSYRDRHGAYDLLTNNCHSFSGRMAKKLLAGDCVPF